MSSFFPHPRYLRRFHLLNAVYSLLFISFHPERDVRTPLPWKVAVIVALPSLWAVTIPFWSTEATGAFMDFHTGLTRFPPMAIASAFVCSTFSVMAVNESMAEDFVTVMVIFSVMEPTVAVMVAFPSLIPVTTPDWETVTTGVYRERHITLAFVPVTLAVNVTVVPASMEVLGALRLSETVA